jgi:DNA-binding NarL/FixJ family response regulator
MAISILMADDHPIVRHGLCALLQAQADFAVVGEAEDGLKAVSAVERLQPDVLILDLMMPGLSGLEVMRLTRQRSPDTRIVVLSMHSNEAYVLEALRNGAAAYVLKRSSADELVNAVREVVAGRSFLSRSISPAAVEAYRHRAEEAPPDPYERLTNRERQVLHLVAEGHTYAEIGRRLVISPRTVESHCQSMMRKLGVSTRADVTRYALQRGILPLEDT